MYKFSEYNSENQAPETFLVALKLLGFAASLEYTNSKTTGWLAVGLSEYT